MAVTINADNGVSSGSAGLKQTADSTGVLALQTNGTTAVTVDTSQNVGIGTASPTQKLDLGSGFVKVGQGVGGGGGVWFPYSSDAAGRTWRVRSDIVGYGDFGFEQSTTQTGTTFATKLLMDASGNLLLGTTSIATYTTRLNILSPSTLNAAIHCRTDTSSTQSQIIFGNATSANVGSISTSSSTTTYSTSSDYRLKENVQPMQNALVTLSKLKPVTYTWKADGLAGQGFIAHELQEICPDAVIGEKDAVEEDGSIKPQGIDTSFLVATLTAAIQEQQALIQTLTDRITALETKT